MVTSNKNQKFETVSPVFDLVHRLAALGVVGASGAAPVPFSGQEQSE